MAGFQLNLEIGGLCLFVSQPSTNKMHVVMPKMTMGGEHSDHRHIPVLVFDAAHLKPAALSFGVLNVHVPLRNLAVEIGDGRGATPTICDDVVDITDVTKGALLQGVLDARPPTQVTSRLTLTSGKMEEISTGVCWKWTAGKARRMANWALWRADMAVAGLSLDFVALNNDGEGFKLDLVPRPGADGGPATIDFTIHHSPPGDLPPEPGAPEEPAVNAPAPHFEAYYTLFQASIPAVFPLFDSADGCTAAGGCTESSDMGGSPYTCMVAGVTI